MMPPVARVDRDDGAGDAPADLLDARVVRCAARVSAMRLQSLSRARGGRLVAREPVRPAPSLRTSCPCASTTMRSPPGTPRRARRRSATRVRPCRRRCWAYSPCAQLLVLVFGDLTDVAEDVRAERFVRIVADGLRLDVDAREIALFLREPRDLRRREVVREDDGAEGSYAATSSYELVGDAAVVQQAIPQARLRQAERLREYAHRVLDAAVHL